MERVKHQHYVPQFLLRRFANDRDQLHVFDKREMRAFVSHVDRAAGERDFFDTPDMQHPDVPDQYMERHYLKQFEEKGARAIQGLVQTVESGVFRRLRGARRADLAEFMVIQKMRTREHREEVAMIASLTQEIVFRAHLERTQPELADQPFTVDLGEDGKRRHHAQSMFDFDNIADMTDALLENFWQIRRTAAPAVFWLSDNPVFNHGHIESSVRSMSGFRSRGVETVLPISPTLLVSVFDRRHFFMFEPINGRLQESIPDNVTFYNSLQVQRSTRFVFSSSPDFALAEEMCTTHPDLRNPNRPRFVVEGGPWRNLTGRRLSTGTQISPPAGIEISPPRVIN